MSELSVALAFAEAGIAIIPVRIFLDGERLRKRPHIKAWRERASTDASLIGEWWQAWPEAVPGIVLEHSGLVVVDCDRHVGGADGVAAFAALGPFAAHPVVRTPSGGEHHYFRQPDPPIAWAAWADGIDVLGTSRFVVAPGAGGYTLVVGGAAPELPEVFGKQVVRRAAVKGSAQVCVAKGEGNAGAVLAKLNPRHYRNHGRWLRLMMACNAAGIEREAFIAWSVGDPLYADDAEEIGERWDSLKDGGITAETLFREARLDELNDWLDSSDDGPWHSTHTWKVPIKGEGGDHAAQAGNAANVGAGATRNLKRRADYILRKVKDEPTLFWAACMFREIIAEGRLKPWIAVKLLEGAGRRIGLDLEGCRRTIASAFLTVERKLKKPRYVLAPGALREWHGYGAKGRYQLAQEYSHA